MKTKIIILIFGLLIFTSLVEAQENNEVSAPEIKVNIYDDTGKLLNNNSPDGGGDSDSLKINCSDYYDFKDVKLSLSNEKVTYNSGEKIKIVGNLNNASEYPIVNGEVFARISRKNPNFITEGNYIVDEVFLMENIVLSGGEKKDFEFDWSIPDDIANGDYRMEYFFSVGKKFNLSGINYSDKVVAGFLEFTIVSNQSSSVFFNGASTEINGKNYKQSRSEFIINPQEEVLIKQSIQNSFSENKEVSITYNLYGKNFLNQNNLESTKTENIVLGAQESRELLYVIPHMDKSSYYLQIIAKSGKSKSIVNVRILSSQEDAAFNYLAVTEFPIPKGDEFTLFSCFSNGFNIKSEGRMEIILRDEKDNEIGKIDYNGAINGNELMEKADFVSSKDYNYLKLIAKIYDKNNKLSDEYETIYDCRDFNKCTNVGSFDKKIFSNDGVRFLPRLFITLFVIVFILTVAVVVIKKRR